VLLERVVAWRALGVLGSESCDAIRLEQPKGHVTVFRLMLDSYFGRSLHSRNAKVERARVDNHDVRLVGRECRLNAHRIAWLQLGHVRDLADFPG
jgi:hypothetical protein